MRIEVCEADNATSFLRPAIMAIISKLPTLVREAFRAAQKSGDLTFYQTQVSILQCNGLPVSLSSRNSPLTVTLMLHSFKSGSLQLLQTSRNLTNLTV